MRYLTREQIQEIDRRAIEEYSLPGLLLMENAGRSAAQILLARYAPRPPGPACVFCGGGNNGGDGYVIARHLANAGWQVGIVSAAAGKMSPDARANHEIARRMALPLHPFGGREAQELAARSGLYIDALLGTGFSGAVRPPLEEAIACIRAAPRDRRVAVDVPSGLDCNTGQAAGPAVEAGLTITFVAPKTGFATPGAARYLGEVVVADIGAPRALVEEVAGAA